VGTEFDYAQLDAITGGDAEFEHEVLQEYLASAPKDMARLKAAVLAGDAAAVSSSAHGLKGASATIGAKGFAAVALELEQAGKKGELGNALGMFARLDAEYNELAGLIRQRLARAA
jgi:HPt (histidine-containing phosphotransfer) domain-containing protein